MSFSHLYKFNLKNCSLNMYLSSEKKKNWLLIYRGHNHMRGHNHTNAFIPLSDFIHLTTTFFRIKISPS